MESKEFLLRLRKEKRLSQTELAEELGITRQTISRWEAGLAMPSAENLIGLSRVYGMTVEELFQDRKEENAEVADTFSKGNAKEGAAPPDALDAALKNCGRKKVWLIVSMAAAGIFALIYLWGVFTNSINSAKLTIAFFGVIMLLGAGVFGLYRMWNKRRTG